MTLYRFVTQHRTGKWYRDLDTAQRHAYEIGAGFLDPRAGSFVTYVGTKLEMRHEFGPTFTDNEAA